MASGALPGKPMPFKQMANILFDENPGTDLNKSNKCPLVIDANDNPMAGTFLKYRNVNMLYAQDPIQFGSAETLRMALLGALRWGKPIVIDLGNNNDLFNLVKERFDEVSKGTMDAILNNSIIDDKEYGKMVKKTDAPEYQLNNCYMVSTYKFVFLTTNPQVPQSLLDATYPLHVVM